MSNPTNAVDWKQLVYNLLLVLLLPVAIVYLLWRLVIRGKSRHGLAERLGTVPLAARKSKNNSEPVIWVQAVSVGEVAAAKPILHHLHHAEP